MANITITNVDVGAVILRDGKFQDEGLLFAAADTFAEGTILARKAVSDTITVTADGGNTGTFTLAAAPNAGRTLIAGTYVLTAGDLTAGVGPWTLTDPLGNSQIVSTAGGSSDDDLNFTALGVTVTVTDPGSGTAFDDADTADLVVAAQSGTPLVPFDPAGTGGEQEPLSVLTYEVARTSGGTERIRALVQGEVDKTKLLIDVDGDGDNITAIHLDKLRAAGIFARDMTELADLDNQ